MSQCSTRRCLLLAALLPVALGAPTWEDAYANAALAVDGQCETTSLNGSECALNALQFRGRKVRTDAAASDAERGRGSCGAYGCADYAPDHTCQCNDKCRQYGDCCSDYEARCAAPVGMRGSCEAYGCAGYAPDRTCQCNDKCHQYSDCCSDYEARCAARRSSGGKIFGRPSASAKYPSHPGFTLMLVEEFEKPIDLDADPIWTWSDGGLEEGQARFVKENIKFQEGKMIIEMSSKPPSNAQPCSHAEVDVIPNNKTMTSGEIRTRHNMFRYGRYEVRMKAPTVQPSNPMVDGNFISTMFVFRAAKFKHWREIDIEILGDSSGTVSTNVITGENVTKFRIDMDRSKKYEAPFNVREDFHTYAFEWLPDRVTWFVDGKVIRKEKAGKVPIPELPGKIIMNLWQFDKRALFGGKKIWNNRLPMHSEYDWFRFYKWDGDAQYPCAGLGEACLTEDDKYLSSNNPCDGIPQVGTVLGDAPCTAVCIPH